MPIHLNDYVVQLNQGSAIAYFMMEDTIESEPTSCHEAQGKSEWENAMIDEITTLMKNSTWDLVPKPNDVDVITGLFGLL